ncbi:MAG: DUF2442 domain-containing protein [Flavobacteriales bacterium]
MEPYLNINGMSILTVNKSKFATNLSFTDSKMIVEFEDGRELSIPLEWFVKLRNATKIQLENWRFIGKGEGVHWEDLDEDISIEHLLG